MTSTRAFRCSAVVWLTLAAGMLSGLTGLLLVSPARAAPAKAASKPLSQSPTGSTKAASKPLSQSLAGPAKADFEAAKLLANDGDFASALIKFQSAYEVSKDPRLLWNVAFCQKNLRHYSKVITTLRRYIDEGTTLLSDGDRKEAQELIAMIEPFTTRVTFRVQEVGAAVYVDDELIGTSPLGSPAFLDIGERRIRVTKEGFLPFEKAIAIGGSSDITVEATLEKEVHAGKLIVNAPRNAVIFIDDKQAAIGKFEQTVLSGGHQLRVTAAGMRPYQSEIVIQDKETRSIEIALEAEIPPEKPKLRVAVGCSDSEPKGPDDGLVVYLDGPDVLAPTAVKKRWSDELRKNVVEYVEYPIASGTHQLRLSITDCLSLDQSVIVDPRQGADVSGALRADRFVLFRGPQGSPGWFRLGLGLWMPGGSAKDTVPEKYTGKFGDVWGSVVQLGVVGRWFGMYVDGMFGKGSFERSSFDNHYALPNPAKVSWQQLSMRLGPRIPFNVVAFGMGASIGTNMLNVHQVRTGKLSSVGGLYAELDVQPLCDWGIFVLGKGEKPFNEDGPIGALQAGLFFEPNAQCRKERATRFGLSQTGRAGR